MFVLGWVLVAVVWVVVGLGALVLGFWPPPRPQIQHRHWAVETWGDDGVSQPHAVLYASRFQVRSQGMTLPVEEGSTVWVQRGARYGGTGWQRVGDQWVRWPQEGEGVKDARAATATEVSPVAEPAAPAIATPVGPTLGVGTGRQSSPIPANADPKPSG